MRKSFALVVFVLFAFFANSQNVLKMNQKDAAGKKQGHWIYYGKDRPESGVPLEGKVEEGGYKDDRKDGVWVKYYANGVSPKIIGAYENNRPTGMYQKFYISGALKESGCFRQNHHCGMLVYYAENCDTIEAIHYDDNGKILDTLVKRIPKVMPVSKPDSLKIIPSGFNPDGFNKIFTEDKLLWQEGEFKNGRLIDGKVYEYDQERVLLKVKVYKDYKQSRVEQPRSCYGSTTLLKTSPLFLPNGKNHVQIPEINCEEEGVFQNGVLWNGKRFFFDANGVLQKVELIENGISKSFVGL